MTLSDANAPQFELVEEPVVSAPAEDAPVEDSEDDSDGREN